MRVKLILISLLHVMIGVFLSLSHGIFYGDAINFYSYREFLDFSFDLNFIDLIQNINVGFVSIVYATPLQCFFVNILTVIILNNSISYVLSISSSKHVNSIKHLKVFYILTALVILCPSVITRIGEPSREYMQNIFLFLAGVFLTISLKRFAFFLFIIVLIRPVMLPIYFLWLGFVHVYRKKQRYVLLYMCLTIVSIVFALDEFSKFNFYSEKSIGRKISNIYFFKMFFLSLNNVTLRIKKGSVP